MWPSEYVQRRCVDDHFYWSCNKYSVFFRYTRYMNIRIYYILLNMKLQSEQIREQEEEEAEKAEKKWKKEEERKKVR